MRRANYCKSEKITVQELLRLLEAIPNKEAEVIVKHDSIRVGEKFIYRKEEKDGR